MRPWVRFLMIAMVLAFAAGTMAHAVQAASMEFKMAPGCDGCGGEDNGKVEKTCSDLCVAPAVAVLPTMTAINTRMTKHGALPMADLITGELAPPDPYPPKSFLN